MRAWKTAALVAMAAMIACVVYVAILVHDGFSARDNPSRIETFAAQVARHLATPSSFRSLKNPYSETPENIQAGMAHFADHCATCHANDGSGSTLFGKGLYPKPPDMRASATQEKSDGELYYIIENGVRLSGMPAFGERSGTEDAETWHLVVFIRHLPQLTTEELQKMVQFNPKTESDRQEEKEEEEFLEGK
jgi:mono/diheme cytochrome c family protein